MRAFRRQEELLVRSPVRDEGSAVGFDKQRRGARSYYPLFCTVAQTGQFLDVHHRPGNVHDSNGACELMTDCLDAVRAELPRAKLETRIDSAFFDEKQAGSPGGGTGDRVPAPAENRLAGAGAAPARVTSSPETLALARSAHSGTGETAGDSDVAVSARENPRLAEGVVLTPQGLSVAHLDRRVGEGLLAVAPRLPWAAVAPPDVRLRCARLRRLRRAAATLDRDHGQGGGASDSDPPRATGRRASSSHPRPNRGARGPRGRLGPFGRGGGTALGRVVGVGEARDGRRGVTRCAVRTCRGRAHLRRRRGRGPPHGAPPAATRAAPPPLHGVRWGSDLDPIRSIRIPDGWDPDPGEPSDFRHLRRLTKRASYG